MKKILLLSIAAMLFSLAPTRAQNVLINGDFQTGLVPWTTYIADWAGVVSTVDTIDGEIKFSEITIPGSGNETWHIQLYQPFSSDQLDMLKKDSTYELTFDAIADAERECKIFFGQNEGSYLPVFDTIFNLTAEDTSYSYKFVIDSVYTVMKFGFEIGRSDVPVTFDNVVLAKVAGVTSIDKVDLSTVKVFPIPASNLLTISVENGSTVYLYNVTGVLFKTGISENSLVSFEVGSLPKGIYLLEVNKGNSTFVSKVIIE